MICYKDKSFCEWSGCCDNTDCPRWLDAGAAYMSGLPVSIANFRTDDCGFIPTEHYKAIKEESDRRFDELNRECGEGG